MACAGGSSTLSLRESTNHCRTTGRPTTSSVTSRRSSSSVATELDERRLVTLDVVGLPVVRQWFVLSRKDKVLLPPAQAMLDFLSAKGAQFLPRTHGRLRLTRPSAPAKRA